MRQLYWIDFKATNANKLLFLKLVVETRAIVSCFHQGKRSKWSIQFPFGDSIDIFKLNSIFAVEDMSTAVLKCNLKE